MVLTLFISEDKRDEFAGTAWPFDSLLEHTNQGALAQTDVGLSPEPRPSQPGPGQLLHLPGGLGPCPRWGLARRVLSPKPPAGEQSRGAPASPHLGSFTVRSKLRSWEASWEPGAPAFSPGSCFPGPGGNLVGTACCPFPTRRGGKTVLEGPRAACGHQLEPSGGREHAGWAGPPREPWLLVSGSPH